MIILIACFPPNYGTSHKGDYEPYDNPNFISLLSPSGEIHFKFLAGRSIKALIEKGVETIEALQLNHVKLHHRRERVITGAIYLKGVDRSISAVEAVRLADEVLLPNYNSCLREFCIAIHQIALKHSERQERRARRTAGQSQR